MVLKSGSKIFLKDRTADLKIWRAFLELFRKESEE